MSPPSRTAASDRRAPPEASGARFFPGRRVGRYELLAPLADGGMASVWSARLRGSFGFEKLVAIKTIRREFASEARYLDMFLDEARVAAAIRHPHVAEILDLGIEDDDLFIVLEWIDGDSLAALLRGLAERGEAVPRAVALRIVADACAGLHAVHELRGEDGSPLQVVHRDISPQNLLVDSHGMAKVIDFGIAKARGRLAASTGAGTIKGKLAFMAPEQASGHSVDRRTDVWALGVVLYLLLTGGLPYRAPSQAAMLQLLTSGPELPPLDEVPALLRPVIRRVLAVNPDDRYDTLAELERDLEHAIAAVGPVTATEVAAVVRRALRSRLEARRATIRGALEAADAREAAAATATREPSLPPPRHRAPAFPSLPPESARAAVDGPSVTTPTDAPTLRFPGTALPPEPASAAPTSRPRPAPMAAGARWAALAAVTILVGFTLGFGLPLLLAPRIARPAAPAAVGAPSASAPVPLADASTP